MAEVPFVHPTGLDSPPRSMGEMRGALGRDRTISIVPGDALSPAANAAARRVLKVLPAILKDGFDHDKLSQFIANHYGNLGLSYDVVSDPALLREFVETVLSLQRAALSPRFGERPELAAPREFLKTNREEVAVFLQRSLYHRAFLNALIAVRDYEVQRDRLMAHDVVDERIASLRERAAVVFAQSQQYDRTSGYDEGGALSDEDSLVADLARFQSPVSTDSVADVVAPTFGIVNLDDLEEGAQS